jgi:cyclomaltodextrinase / maltogenic alpha-amylase / neopullulanase
MTRIKALIAAGLTIGTLESSAAFAQVVDYANRHDKALAGVFAKREADWRNGAVVYQVLVDRFVPPANLEAKRALYPAPKVLRSWNEVPQRGTYLEAQKLWSHEIDFWGGDLKSMKTRLDYVQGLGVDVLYLNPIHLAYTNHKYDALDYLQISPEFGTREDVKALAAETRQRKMKLVLDGVFNHMGRNSPLYREAEANPNSRYRNWFVFGKQYPSGVRAWWGAENLPELNLENPQVRDYLYAGKNSVVRQYLRDGVDGWRLDVAFDLGFNYLEDLTKAAHAERPGSLVVGEIASYPKEWFPSIDGIMNFTMRRLILDTAAEKIPPATTMNMLNRLIADAGIEPILKSWVLLDNHDNPRVATVLPDVRKRRLAQVMQFTLPGAPNLYYGSEVAMEGGDDPEMRAPMRWDRVEQGHPELAWTRSLIQLRKQYRALRIGNYRPLSSTRLIAFERYTDRALDTVLVLVNPTGEAVTETVMVANSKVMDGSRWFDAIDTRNKDEMLIQSALLPITLPAYSYRVLRPEWEVKAGYSHYKRVK